MRKAIVLTLALVGVIVFTLFVMPGLASLTPGINDAYPYPYPYPLWFLPFIAH